MTDRPPRQQLPGWAIGLLIVVAILVLGFGGCLAVLRV